MKTIAYIRWADPPLWMSTLACSLPLWLFFFLINPAMPGPLWVGWAVFYLAVAVIILLLWLRWLTPEIILYSFFPIIPGFLFDEMFVSYESSFYLICALLLTIGIFGYRLSLQKDAIGLGWLALLVVFFGTWILASHANQHYWQMVTNLGYTCAPGSEGCPPLAGNTTPPWLLFFKL